MKRMNYREFKDAVAQQIHGYFVREVSKDEVHVFSKEEQDMYLDKIQIVGAGQNSETAPVADLYSWYKEYINRYEGNFEDAIYYLARRYEKAYHETVVQQKKEKKPQTDVVPGWISRIDNLISALEIYRNEEAKAIRRLEELLAEQGIHISQTDIKDKEAEELREQISMEEKKNQMEQERLAKEQMEQLLNKNEKLLVQNMQEEQRIGETSEQDKEIQNKAR